MAGRTTEEHARQNVDWITRGWPGTDFSHADYCADDFVSAMEAELKRRAVPYVRIDYFKVGAGSSYGIPHTRFVAADDPEAIGLVFREALESRRRAQARLAEWTEHVASAETSVTALAARFGYTIDMTQTP